MPSANDNYASRTALTPVAAGTASFDNTGNTFEAGGGEPWNLQIFRTGWYTITPTTDDRMIFRFRVTALPTGGTVQIHFYRDTGALNTLASFEYDATYYPIDGGNAKTSFSNQFVEWTGATVNEWYEWQLTDEAIAIQIGVTNTAHEGTIAIEWDEQAKPANDEWVDREVITGNSGSESGTTEGATFDDDLFDTIFGGIKWPLNTDYAESNDWASTVEQRMKGIVFYSFTPDIVGNYELLVNPTGGASDIFGIVLAGDAYADLQQMAWAAESQTIQVDLISGVEYTIGVAGLNLGSPGTMNHADWRGTFDLEWELLAAPPNNEPITAEVLVGDSGSATNFTVEGATYNPEILSDYSWATDVWYVYSPTTSGWYEFDLGSVFAPGSTILGLVRQLEDLTYQVIRFGAPPSTFSHGLRSGETYYLVIGYSGDYQFYAHNSSPDFTSFDWALSATAPANDDFADAEVITGASGSVGGTVEGATGETDEPLGFDQRATVWYSWACPASDFYRFTNEGDGRDVQCAVYTGSELDELEGVAFNYDGLYPYGNGEFQVGFDATIGTTYYIQVSVYFGDAAPYDFTMEWDTATPPPHSAFADADELPSLEDQVVPLEFSSLGAPAVFDTDAPDPDPDEDGSSVKGRDVWHKWTPPVTSIYEFTFDVPGWDAFVAIYRLEGAEDPVNLVLIDEGRAVEYDTQTFDSYTGVIDNGDPYLYEEGATYYFRIMGAAYEALEDTDLWAAESGGYAITWVRVATPPNNDDLTNQLDNYGNAGNLTQYDDPHYTPLGDVTHFFPSGGRFEATNFDATAQVGEVSTVGFGPERSVWFSFEAPSDPSGVFRFWIESDELTDMVMSVYDNNFTFNNPASPGTLLDSDDDSGPGLMPEVQFTAVFNEGYLFHVDSRDDPGGDFRLRWVKITASPPANDDFADAIELVGESDSVTGDTTDATVEEFEPSGGGVGPQASVWYKITTPINRTAQFTLTPDTNTTWGLWGTLFRGTTLENLVDATGVTFAYLSSDDPGDPSVATWQLSAGEQYYIQIMGQFDTADTFTLDFTLASLTPPAGDPFSTPIDSGTGAGSTAGDTEGSTTEAGEPSLL